MVPAVYVGKSKMKSYLVLLFGLLTIGPAKCWSQSIPIVKFYPIADSVTHFPPVGKKLVVLCEKKIDRWYVSFVGLKTEAKVMIAVVTTKHFTRPDSISLTVAFDGYRPRTGSV